MEYDDLLMIRAYLNLGRRRVQRRQKSSGASRRLTALRENVPCVPVSTLLKKPTLFLAGP